MEVFHPSQREALGLNKNLSIPVTVALRMHTHTETKCMGKTEIERAPGRKNETNRGETWE